MRLQVGTASKSEEMKGRGCGKLEWRSQGEEGNRNKSEEERTEKERSGKVLKTKYYRNEGKIAEKKGSQEESQHFIQ